MQKPKNLCHASTCANPLRLYSFGIHKPQSSPASLFSSSLPEFKHLLPTMSYAEVTAAGADRSSRHIDSLTTTEHKKRSQKGLGDPKNTLGNHLTENHIPSLSQEIWAKNANDVPYVHAGAAHFEPGVAKGNVVATAARPDGTTENEWAEKHKHMTVRASPPVAFLCTTHPSLTPFAAPPTTLLLLGPRQRRRHLAHGHLHGLPQLGLAALRLPARRRRHQRRPRLPDLPLVDPRPVLPHLPRPRAQGQARLRQSFLRQPGPLPAAGV